MEAQLPRFFEFATLCAAVYLVGYCYRSVSWPKSILKTASVATLAVVALFAHTPIWLPLALIACAVGDFYLSRNNASSFLSGVGAFAVGHLFYIILFLTDPLAKVSRISEAPQVATLSILVFISLIMFIWVWYRAGDLRYAVAGYIFIITSMGIAAASLPWQANYNSVLLGILFFILSDLILSAELFLLSEDGSLRKIAPFIVWTFYWLAQVLITAGFVLRAL